MPPGVPDVLLVPRPTHRRHDHLSGVLGETSDSSARDPHRVDNVRSIQPRRDLPYLALAWKRAHVYRATGRSDPERKRSRMSADPFDSIRLQIVEHRFRF